MVERIGIFPAAPGGFHASAESQIIPQQPGRKSTFAVGPTGGIYNVYSAAPIILPAALGYLIPASISDDIIGPGSILRNINNVAPYPITVGTITDNITGVGAINRTIIGAGNILDLATVGAVSYTAGGAATLAAGGVANVTAGGAANVTAGALVTITGATALVTSATTTITGTAGVVVTGATIALN